MKWRSRGACAAFSSCLLLSCALCATAVGLKCFSLGSELRGEPFRLETAAGAFYSGLLLLAGLSLLGWALLCCHRHLDAPRGQAGQDDDGGRERCTGGRPNLLLLGMLLFMLGVLSAFAGAVIDGDSVSLVGRKYSHFCLQYLPPPGEGGFRAATGSTDRAKCVKLKDYQRGLVLSTIFNSLECLLGLLNLLLVKNYKSAQQQRRRRLGRGGRLENRPSAGSIFSVENEDFALPCTNAPPLHSVSYIRVGVCHILDEAGVEVHCGGHPSVELPGYSPMDPELNPSYPYSHSLSSQMPPDYAELYPRENRSRVSDN